MPSWLILKPLATPYWAHSVTVPYSCQCPPSVQYQTEQQVHHANLLNIHGSLMLHWHYNNVVIINMSFKLPEHNTINLWSSKLCSDVWLIHYLMSMNLIFCDGYFGHWMLDLLLWNKWEKIIKHYKAAKQIYSKIVPSQKSREQGADVSSKSPSSE